MIWARVVASVVADGLIVGLALYLFLIFHNDYPVLSCAGAGIFAALWWRGLMGKL